VSNELLTADVQRVLARRANQAGRVEKLATIPDTVFMPSILQEIDEATMSAAFVISTADVDRSGDKVETAGIRLEHHRANPVVLWDHGKGPIGKLPIGKCQDDAGNYTVVIRPEEGVAVARIFFAKDLPFARDIFLLVKGGYLRGSSIGFLPLRAAIMPGADPSDDCPPLHLQETELCEVSVTAVPDNPRALKIAMTKALGGQRPSPEMLKYLEASAVTTPKQPTDTAKTKLNAKFADDYGRLNLTGKAKLNKALAEITGKAADDYLPLDEEGKVTDDAMNTGTVADGAAVTPVETPPVETVSVDAVAEDTPAWKQPLDGPPSQAAATDIHTRLLDVADAIEGWSSRQENQTFKPILDELAEAIKEKAGSLSSFHDEEHPDAPPLGVGEMDADVDVDDLDDDEDDEPDPDADPDEVKEKAARKLRLKTVKEWRTKRLNNLRGKRMGPLITKGLSKRVSGICTKAATFLEKAEEHEGDWSETHKAASGYHGKALRELCKAGEAIADAAGDDDAIKTKAIKDKLAATEAELVKHKDAATKWMKIAGSFKKACDKLKNKAR
jgi:hypothetical protein